MHGHMHARTSSARCSGTSAPCPFTSTPRSLISSARPSPQQAAGPTQGSRCQALKYQELGCLAEIQPRGKPETKADADVSKRDLISSATSWQQLAAMMTELDDSAGRNRGLVFTMLARMAEMSEQLAGADQKEVHTTVDRMVAVVLEKLDSISPRTMTNLMVNLAQIGYCSERQLHLLLHAVAARTRIAKDALSPEEQQLPRDVDEPRAPPPFFPNDLLSILSAAAVLGLKPRNPKSEAQQLLGLSRTNLALLLDSVAPKLRTMEHADIANAVFATAKLVTDAGFFAGAEGEAARMPADKGDRFLRQLEVATRLTMQHLQPEVLTDLATIYGRAGYKPSEVWAERFLQQTQRAMRAASARDALALLVCAARCQLDPADEWLEALLPRLKPKALDFAGLAALLTSLTALCEPPAELLDEACEALTARFAARRSSPKAAHVTSILQALVQAEFNPGDALLDELLPVLESCLPDMGLEELVELGSGLAGFGYQPDELWRDAFFTAVMEYEIEQWGAREVAGAFAMLGALGAPSLALQQQLQQLLVEACGEVVEEALGLGLAQQLAQLLGAFDSRLNAEARAQLWACVAEPMLQDEELAAALGPRGFSALLRAAPVMGADVQLLLQRLGESMAAGAATGLPLGAPAAESGSDWFMDSQEEEEQQRQQVAGSSASSSSSMFSAEDMLGVLELLRDAEVQPPAAVLQAAAAELTAQPGPASAARAKRLLQLAEGAGWQVPVAVKLELVKAAGAAQPRPGRVGGKGAAGGSTAAAVRQLLKL